MKSESESSDTPSVEDKEEVESKQDESADGELGMNINHYSQIQRCV